MDFLKYNTKVKEVKDYLMEKYLTDAPDGTDEVVNIS
jgi:hypothetical protein